MSDDKIKMDNSHVSKHFLKGTYDHPITQKGHVKDGSFQAHTDVDRHGNVIVSDFSTFMVKK